MTFIDKAVFYGIIELIKYGRGDIIMQKYQCTVCMYIYDPEQGDETQGIEPGTPFEELPDDWTCPDCGVGKDLFEPYE